VAVPKNKISSSRRDKRRASAFKLDVPELVKCSKCGEYKVNHHVCKACGFYNNREVIKKEA
jgi:large subunit ribosomal protein L32